MKAEITQALASLVGRPLAGAARNGGMLELEFGDEPAVPVGSNGASASGGDASNARLHVRLHVSCTWRLASADGILTGSGDYFTPADPDAEPDDFDWAVPGATWCDVRLAAFMRAIGSDPPAVTAIVADDVGGLQLSLTGDLTLVVFPDSSHTEHVETEFWRFLPSGSPAPHVVVGSAGVELQD